MSSHISFKNDRACSAWPGKISDTGTVACDFALDVATLDHRCNAASLQMQGPIVETEDLTNHHQQKDWENLL